MIIRPSTDNEGATIHALHLEAFGQPEGPIVADLACAMLGDASAEPRLSLVAEEEGRIVGHVLFSVVQLDEGDHPPLSILAPLAIASSRQRRGLGTRLVHQGLHMLAASGTVAVFVLGDPNYYQRLGFTAGHAIAPPFPLPYPEAWMAQDLQPGSLAALRGTARCCQALMHPQFW